MANNLLRYLLSSYTNLNAVSIGTKFNPTSPIETEYVELFNYTQTVLFELEKATITSETILKNLLRDIGENNIPDADKYNFYEIKPAEDKIEEYALVSNIIMGSDRYFYISIPEPSRLIEVFVDIIEKEYGEIIERSSTEIVARLPSKNDAIRIAIKLIGIGLQNNIPVISAVGMTGAASIERSIGYTNDIGSFPGVAFTKLGGEFALVFDSPFTLKKGKSEEIHNYLFIDLIGSTKFINKNGRTKLVELMTGIKNYIETECEGEIEGYREGGDDFIARFPSKDLAIRAGLDAAWFAHNNGVKIRAGVGKSRREAGQRAQLVDDIKSGSPLSLVVFELANGLYAYNVPSDFIRTTLDLFINKKTALLGLFVLIFVYTFIVSIFGFKPLILGGILIAVIAALLY